jgi:HAE1 family hydrophobic/amphiphilic exporter-1
MKTPLVLALALSAGTVAAQQTTADMSSPQPPALPPAVPLTFAPRIGITTFVDLTVDEVIRAVLENNRDIEVSRLSRVKALLDLRAAKGFFDPIVGGPINAVRTVTPVASSLGGGTNGAVTERQINADPQISGTSPYLGTVYKLDFSSARIDNNNTFNTLNPTYPTAATLNITQPLWSGLFFDSARERIQVSKSNIQQTEEQFKQRVIDSTSQAIRAYWELDYARRNLEVQIQAVRLAEQQDASNRRQVAQGTQAPIDVVQTQTQLATYQTNVFTAQQQLTQAENTLKALMLPSRLDPLWNAEIRTFTIADTSAPIPTLQEAITAALANRPDLKGGQIGVQLSQLDARLAAEQAKPQINLVAQVESQGLAGRVLPQTGSIFGSIFTDLFTQVNQLSVLAGIPPLPTTGGGTTTTPDFFVGGYGKSLDSLRDFRFPTVRVGLQVSIPIRNRTARAEADSAKVGTRQSMTQQQQLEMTAESDVRNTLQQLINSDFSLRASQRAAQLAQQQLDSEQRQLKAGTSSVYLVLQRQSEFITAKLREIRATADHGEAEADFDRATANTLTRQHIDLKPATTKP